MLFATPTHHATEPPNISITGLPDPILERILEFAGYDGSRGAACACRTLADARSRVLWPSIDVSDPDEAKRIARLVRAGRVAGFRSSNLTATPAGIDLAAALFPRSLASLVLAGRVGADEARSLLAAAADSGPDLAELYIALAEGELLEGPLPPVPSLRTLHVSPGRDPSWIPSAFPGLEHIVLIPDMEPILGALAPLVRLQSLEIRRGYGVPAPLRGSIARLLAGPAGRSLRKIEADGAELGCDDVEALSGAARLETLGGIELVLDPSMPHERLARIPSLRAIEVAAVEAPDGGPAGLAPERLAAALEGRRASLELRTTDGRSASRLVRAAGAAIETLSFPVGSDSTGPLEAASALCPALVALYHAPPYPPGSEPILAALAKRGVRLWICAGAGSRIANSARTWRGPDGGPAPVTVAYIFSPVPWDGRGGAPANQAPAMQPDPQE